MKKIILFIILSASFTKLIAQKVSFDITNYIPPKNWVSTSKEGSYITYTSSNKLKNSYCRITVYKSVASKGGINSDFESEWEGLVAKAYTLSGSLKTSAIQKSGNWFTKTGISSFTFDNNRNNNIILSTSNGFDKATSILIIYNNSDYDSSITNFLTSVSYKKSVAVDPIIAENNNSTMEVTGKWARSVSLSYNTGGMNSGYTKSIYNFKSDNSLYIYSTYLGNDCKIYLYSKRNRYFKNKK